MDVTAQAGFSEFAHSRWTGLARLAYGITGERGFAEELAQAALASAFASWSRIARTEDPDAHVRRILLDAYRRALRRRRVAQEASVPSDSDFVPDPDSRYGGGAPILAALGALPRRQREVIVLRFWLDLTDEQVAQSLGCSVRTVKSRASRALVKLTDSSELPDWQAR